MLTMPKVGYLPEEHLDCYHRWNLLKSVLRLVLVMIVGAGLLRYCWIRDKGQCLVAKRHKLLNCIVATNTMLHNNIYGAGTNIRILSLM